MSKLTNLHDLPPALVRAVTFDDYDRGKADISVTGLLRPPQMAYLEQLHEAEIEEDISERMWLLLGSAAHVIMERSVEAPQIAEERLFMPSCGWTVSGKSDMYDPDTQMITDWKVTSVWSVIYEPQGRIEYRQQLNLYRLLFEANGYPVKGLQIFCVLRDWQKRDAEKRSDYPAVPFKAITVPVWDKTEAQGFMTRRVLLHQKAREEGIYAGCTDEERWKNAKGEYPRCAGYCRVAKFCKQWEATKK